MGEAPSRVGPQSSPLSLHRKPRPYHVYLSGLLVFAASRIVVLLGVRMGELLPRAPVDVVWDVGEPWYQRLLRWDSVWYAGIVRDGYRQSDAAVESSTVFYPLYPAVSYGVKWLFGVDEYLALLIVANVASMAAALLLIKFVKDLFGNETALRSLTFFSFFPSSFFLSAGYTESLCLVLVLLSLMLVSRQRYLGAATVAGFATGTRSSGLVMLPVIVWDMWTRSGLPLRTLLPQMAVCGVLASAGLLAYMAFLWIMFGQPLAFATGQSTWQGGTYLERLAGAATQASLSHLQWSSMGWLCAFAAITIWGFKRLPVSASLYAVGSLLLPVASLGITGSMNRFVLMCVPAFVGMAVLCEGRPWLTLSLTGMFAAGLFQGAALFSQWHWMG